MAIRRRQTMLAGLAAMLPLLSSVGCNHNMHTNPYARPSGNPWATPNPGMPQGAMMPPPVNIPPGQMPPGQQGPVPAVPNLPPPTTNGLQMAPMGAPSASITVPPSAGVQRPNWNDPGTITQQRHQANMFDPFANNEVGPEIVGGRPRGFQKPMTEATRAQGFRNTQTPF